MPVRQLRSAVAGLLLAVSTAVAAPAPAGGAKPMPVPGTAVLVAQVQGVERVKGRVTKFAEAAVPDLAADAVKKAGAAIRDALQGRDLSALTADGRVFVAVMSFENLNGPDAPLAVFLPVSDYKTFREKALTADERKVFEKGKDGVDRVETDAGVFYLVETAKGAYVAVTRDKDTAATLAEGKADPLSPAKMGAGVADAFLSADLSVYVNLDAVNDKYGDAIRQFRQLMQQLLAGGLPGGLPGIDKRQLDTIKKTYDSLFQAVEDGKGLAVGVDVRPEGVVVRMDAAFVPDSATGKLFAGGGVSPLAGLAALPKGAKSYTATKLSKGLARMLTSFAAPYASEEGDPDKAREAIDKLLDLTAAASEAGTLQAVFGPSNMLDVSTPADPKAYADAQAKAIKGLSAGGGYLNVILKEKPTLKEAAETHAGFTFHAATFKLDFEATAKNVPENVRDATVASMKKFVGETTRVWFGTDGKRYVQLTAADWAAAKKTLDAYLAAGDKVAAVPAFAAARALLPAEASVVSLLDVGESLVGYAELMGGVMAAVPGFPLGELPKLAPAKEQAFAGMAATVQGSAVRFEFVVPVGAVKVGREVLKPILDKAKDQ